MGLLNSLSNHTKELVNLMNPLRHHLCVTRDVKHKKLNWTAEDSKNFTECKEKVKKIMESKISFLTLGNPLALITDWSAVGSGFVLKQKTCKCTHNPEKVNINCCKEGWSTIQAGSTPNRRTTKRQKERL